ncbi:MAG: DMT family transporter [Acidiferrobacterales bacterium]
MKELTYTDGDNIKLAVLAIVFTVFALSLGDALIKQISADFPLWQIFVVRSVVAIPVLIAVIRARYQFVSLKPLTVGWTALRSLMLTFMWVAYYTALPHVALSVAAAVYYTLPLFITLFAALFISEKVGVQGWVAVFLGFCGVLLILKPQAEEFNAYALLPLISAILYAFAMIITRTKCKNESPLVLSFGLNISFISVGAFATFLIWFWGPSNAETEAYRFLLGRWISMGGQEWLAMGLLATAIIIGSVGAAIAYQAGPSSIVSTFDFSYLAFAALWGLLFFAEVPDAITAAGILLIAAAGILAVRRCPLRVQAV